MDKDLVLKEFQKQLARVDYASYCKYVNGSKWILGKHLEYVASKVEDVIDRKIPQNILIISMPPQHGKSQLISETLPSYYLGKNPEKRVIEVSYGDDLAKRFGRFNKSKMLQFGQDLFNLKLSRATDTDLEVEGNTGSLINRGIMAGITGQPGDLIIIDDPVKNRAEAESETYRNRVWEEFLNSIYTRLSANGVIILIMTRWHEDDLAGRILKTVPQKVLEINIPLEAEDGDLLGRTPGDALFPEIGKDKAWLEDFKQVYISEEGTRSWYALMQGQPTAADGNLFKRDWWKYYEQLPPLPISIMTVDATFKDTSKSDFVAIEVWGKRGNDYYLIDLLNKRMGFVDTVAAVREMKRKHSRVQAIYIEDKANGSAIIDVLRRSIGAVIPYNPGRDSKESRASAISPLVEAQRVYLPKFGTFTEEFVRQCGAFPNGTNDDMVDGMSMALNILRYRIADLPTEQVEYDPVYGGTELDEWGEMLKSLGTEINSEMFDWG